MNIQRDLKELQKNEKKSKIQKSKNLGKNFWNKEYSQTDSDKFSLSENPSEDLQKFTRWLGREYKDEYINKYTKFIDAGCGNGRNSIWLSETFGAKGIGYDLSEIAIKNANQKKLEKKLENNLNFFVQNLNQPIKAENNSHDLVLDMVASHVLRKEEREYFKNEVLRVLKSGGYYFLKSLPESYKRYSENVDAKGQVIKAFNPRRTARDYCSSLNIFGLDWELAYSAQYSTADLKNKLRYAWLPGFTNFFDEKFSKDHQLPQYLALDNTEKNILKRDLSLTDIRNLNLKEYSDFGFRCTAKPNQASQEKLDSFKTNPPILP
jgi:SAM-dependent methyltransferase